MLTDEDRAALEGAILDARKRLTQREGWPLYERIAEHFQRLGQERMRERAAKRCDLYALADSANDATSPGPHTPADIAVGIRALEVE